MQCGTVIRAAREHAVIPWQASASRPGSALAADDLLTFLDDRVAKWSKPDAVVFVDPAPPGATGKVLKNQLRNQFDDYYLSARDTDVVTTQFHSSDKP